jgi:hypothetical protein
MESKQVAFSEVMLSIANVVGGKLAERVLALLATLGGFCLWYLVLNSPDIYQLIGLGLYGGLVQIPLVWRLK